MINRYINDLSNIDIECKSFILRQIKRMPDHYRFCLTIICSLFCILKLKPENFQLLDKFISSLIVVKNYEKNN